MHHFRGPNCFFTYSDAVRAVPALASVPVGLRRGHLRRENDRHRDRHLLVHPHHRRVHGRKVSPGINTYLQTNTYNNESWTYLSTGFFTQNPGSP